MQVIKVAQGGVLPYIKTIHNTVNKTDMRLDETQQGICKNQRKQN